MNFILTDTGLNTDTRNIKTVIILTIHTSAFTHRVFALKIFNINQKPLSQDFIFLNTRLFLTLTITQIKFLLGIIFTLVGNMKVLNTVLT